MTPSPQTLESPAIPGRFTSGFMRFIGIAEITGALGLVLPGILGIARRLVPLAGAGLVVIMIGAVVLSVLRMGVAVAIVPAVVEILLVVVIRGRLERRPRRFSQGSFDVSLKLSQPR